MTSKNNDANTFIRPDVNEIKNTYDHLFRSSISLSKVKDAALGGRLFDSSLDGNDGIAGRSFAWKLFLIPSEPLQQHTPDALAIPPLEPLKAARLEYRDLLLQHMRAPDGSYEDGFTLPGPNELPMKAQRSSTTNLDRNNPLSLHDENPWREWFASIELRKTILQDVERTFPDIPYFRDPDIQSRLTNILYIYSVLHPDIGYRQGMHELLASLYFAVDYDSIHDDDTTLNDTNIKAFCPRSWVSADSFALFSVVMKGVGRWYEWRESQITNLNGSKSPLASHVQLNAGTHGGGDHSLKPYIAPIVQVCNKIQNTYLKMVDPALWRALQSAGIEPQIYGIRWLRLLFTREFSMQEAMTMWDAMFACDPSFDLAQWVCVAMLIRIRNQLIPADYSTQLTHLLRYPSLSSLSSPSPIAPETNSSTLLVRQALTTQMSTTATTGVSIVLENRNLLNIPVEVPDPPPPPARRRPPPGQRGPSSESAGFASSSSSRVNGGHGRQPSASMGLPEFIARGLLERGESLGINKTVMNAVSELKRNLPDLSSSLAARFPGSPASAFADYPMVDERPPSERPPWEPRTRFEMEREISELKALQRKLGSSVTWIVDTLLLDEGEGRDETQINVIKERKREALESLSYVRDVLKGTVDPSNVEDDRLISEEDLKKNKAAEEKEVVARIKPLEPVIQPIPAPPQPAAAITSLDPRLHHQERQRAKPVFPSSTPFTRQTLSSASTRLPPPPSSLLSPSNSRPPNATIHGTTLAPWVHTPSSFSSMESPIATLPRMPPKTSTALHGTPSIPRNTVSLPTSPQSAPATIISRDQAPRRSIQNDPLGVLP